MDFIKNWVFCVCITIIISVIFSVASPKGAMGRFYKIIISLFVFISFIFPFTDFDIDEFRFDFKFENEYQSVVEDTAVQKVEALVQNELINNGINNAAVSCDVTKQGEELYINSVVISVSDSYDCEEVKKIIYNTLGIISEVKHIGD